jgi:hypothetical protein
MLPQARGSLVVGAGVNFSPCYDLTRHFDGRPFRLLDTLGVETEKLERRLMKWRRFGYQREWMLVGEPHSHDVAGSWWQDSRLPDHRDSGQEYHRAPWLAETRHDAHDSTAAANWIKTTWPKAAG